MKKALLGSFILIFFSLQGFSQLLSWTPDFVQEGSATVVITLDATKGNQGLLNYTPTTDVYVHTGVITNFSAAPSDWKRVKFNQDFNTPNPALQAVYPGSNKWQFTISGGLRTYYGLTDPTETIQKIAILFRNGSGTLKQANSDGSDMYIPVYTTSLAARFTVPLMQPTYIPQPETITKNIGDIINMTGVANVPATLKLYLNGSVVQTASNATTVSANPAIGVGGNQTLVVEANDGSSGASDTIRFFVSGSVTVAPLPTGVKDGINYDVNNTSATLVLYAPGKTRVSVIGEFPGSNWIEQPQYQMNKTPDGNYWVYLNMNAVLPVTLVGFTGKNIGNNNVLSWTVANEQDLSYYELQRSKDGQNFSGISQIIAAGKSSYSFSDNITPATSSIYYYRLKSVDKDGNFKYSAVIKIRMPASGKFAEVNPNPFAGKLLVNIESAVQDKATLIITDLSGRQLFEQNKTLSPRK